MTDYAVETNGLSVYYGRHRGILDVDLRVEKGVVFGFLGPNGAGKTTTQRVLMDVIRPRRERPAYSAKIVRRRGWRRESAWAICRAS